MIKNVHGSIVDLLGEAVVAGRYAVGASLPPEPLLCEELGVSRTVIREAVKSLVAKGLLSTGPKVGTRVLPDEQWNWFDNDVVGWQARAGHTREFIRDLQELRRVVEPAAGAAGGHARHHAGHRRARIRLRRHETRGRAGRRRLRHPRPAFPPGPAARLATTAWWCR